MLRNFLWITKLTEGYLLVLDDRPPSLFPHETAVEDLQLMVHNRKSAVVNPLGCGILHPVYVYLYSKKTW